MKTYVTFSTHTHVVDGILIDMGCAVCIDHEECGDGISAAFKMFGDKFQYCCNDHAFNVSIAENNLPRGIVNLSCKIFFQMDQLPVFDGKNFIIDMDHFMRMTKTGIIMDCDGVGNFAMEDKVSRISAIPSNINNGYPTYDFTHIVWRSK